MRFKVLGMLFFLILPLSSVAGGISRDTSCAVVLYNGARYAMDAQGDIVQFGLTIELDNATIPLEDYPQFQEWWQQMCSLFDEMIILRRKGGKSFTDTEKMTA